MKNFILTTAVATTLLISACSSNERDAAKIHADTLTLDTHVDIPLDYMTAIDPAGETDLQADFDKLNSGGLDAAFFIVYTPQGDLTEQSYKDAAIIAETRMSAIEAMSTKYADRAALSRTADETEQAVANGKLAVLVGMENAYPLGLACADQAGCDTEVALWAARGVRYVGITHFGHNQFGDSSNLNFQRDDGPRHNGLSEQGRNLVRSLNKNGVMVDVSHTGKQTMMQAADLSKTPIIASHSGVKAVADSARNLDDEQLLKIKEVGGVAQMVALGAYVRLPTPEQQAARDKLDAQYGDRSSWDQATRDAYMAERAKIMAMAPEASVSDFVDHIDYAVKVAGIDHVGIASDFDGGGGLDGWKDASFTQNVTVEMVVRGYSDEDITKIWGGNLLRVMRAVEAKAAQ